MAIRPIRFDPGITPQIDTAAYAKSALMRQQAAEALAKPLGTALDAVKENNTNSILQRIQQVRTHAEWDNPETQAQLQTMQDTAPLGAYDQVAVNNAIANAPADVLKRMNDDTAASDFGLQAQFGRNVVTDQIEQAKTTATQFTNPTNILTANTILEKREDGSVANNYKNAQLADLKAKTAGTHPDQEIEMLKIGASAKAAAAKETTDKSTQFGVLNAQYGENLSRINALEQEITAGGRNMIQDPSDPTQMIEDPAIAAKRVQLGVLKQSNEQLQLQLQNLRDKNEAKAAYSLKTSGGVITGRNVKLSPEQTKNMDVTYSVLTKRGISPNNATLLLGEMGREGSFLDSSIHGSHTDAANGKTNSGIISYNDPKRKAGFEKYMADNGFMLNGKLVKSVAATAAQVDYVLQDMKTNYPKVYAAMTSKELTPEEADDFLGRQFIGWDQANNSGKTGTARQNLADFTTAAQQRYLNADGTLNAAGTQAARNALPTSGVGQKIAGKDLEANYGTTSITGKPLKLPPNMVPKDNEIGLRKMERNFLQVVKNTTKALEQDAHRSYEASQAQSNAGKPAYNFYRDYVTGDSKLMGTEDYDKTQLVRALTAHPLYAKRKQLNIPDTVFQEAADETLKHYEQEGSFAYVLNKKSVAPIAFDYLEQALNKHVNVLHTQINTKVQNMAEKMSIEANGDTSAVPYVSRILSNEGMFIDINNSSKLKAYREQGLKAVNDVKPAAKPAAVNNNARPAAGTLFDPKTLATSKNADAWRKELAKRQK